MVTNTGKSTASVAVKRTPENAWQRVLWALPLLAIFICGRTVLSKSVTPWLPVYEEAARTGWIKGVDGGLVPVRMVYSGFEGLDAFVRTFVVFFTPFLAGLGAVGSGNGIGIEMGKLEFGGSLYASQRLQALTFLTDVVTVTSILAIESCRRGNGWGVASVPTIFLLAAQLLGAGQMIPLFLFLSYITSPPSKYSSRSARLVPTRYAKTLLPALMMGYIVPALGSFWPNSSLHSKQGWNFIWQFFPIWILLLHEIFAMLVGTKQEEEKAKDREGDLVWLRGTYEFLFLVSAGAYLFVFFASPVPFSQILFGGIRDVGNEASLVEAAGIFLKWDMIFVTLGMGTWILLCWRDLKTEARTEVSWAKLLVVTVAVGAVCGPGASMAVLWAWREEVLAVI